jgi:hypothetical protein
MNISEMILNALAEEHDFDIDAYAGEMIVDPIIDEDELQVSGPTANAVEFLLLLGYILGAADSTEPESPYLGELKTVAAGARLLTTAQNTGQLTVAETWSLTLPSIKRP